MASSVAGLSKDDMQAVALYVRAMSGSQAPAPPSKTPSP
jgi:hypothetical protein